MARPKKSDLTAEMEKIVSGKPPTTPQEQENRLIQLSMLRAQQQIMDGTASSQVLTQFLKLGSSRERLEKEKLEYERKLLEAKAQSIKDEKEIAEMHQNVIDSFKRYSGNFNDE